MTARPRRRSQAGVAAAFIHSKLTPLVIVASLLLGLYAVVALPREEEPQIIVPMIDVFVDLPGASPTEVEQRVTRPLEQGSGRSRASSTSIPRRAPGRAMLVVRFLVGQDEERALVRLNQKLAVDARATAARRVDAARAGALDRRRAGDGADALGPGLRRRARCGRWRAQLQETLKELPDVSTITIIGGRPRQITVELDPPALAARHLDPLAVQQALAARERAHARTTGIVASGVDRPVEAGQWPASADGCATSWWATTAAGPCDLGDVATVTDGGGEPDRLRRSTTRVAAQAFPAVTLSIAKRKGTNAIGTDAAHDRKIDLAARLRAASATCSHGHARLRRNGGAEVERAAVAHAAGHRLGLGADLARARPARVDRRAHRHPGHAGAHAVRLLPLRLHAQPHHALRAHLLDRHPGGRRHRGGGEHRAPRAHGGSRARAWPISPCAPWTKSATPRSWRR